MYRPKKRFRSNYKPPTPQNLYRESFITDPWITRVVELERLNNENGSKMSVESVKQFGLLHPIQTFLSQECMKDPWEELINKLEKT